MKFLLITILFTLSIQGIASDNVENAMKILDPSTTITTSKPSVSPSALEYLLIATSKMESSALKLIQSQAMSCVGGNNEKELEMIMDALSDALDASLAADTLLAADTVELSGLSKAEELKGTELSDISFELVLGLEKRMKKLENKSCTTN